MDWVDVIAGALLGFLLTSLAPNRLIMWTWSPKTKWGKRRLRKRVDSMQASEVGGE